MKAHEHLIMYALDHGMTISVYDGGEWAVKRSTNKQEILDAVHSVDISQLKFRNEDGGDYRGVAGIVLDGEEIETVNDFTCYDRDRPSETDHLYWLDMWEVEWSAFVGDE